MRPRGAGGGAGRLRVSSDPGWLGVLGSLDHGRVHGGALLSHQAADRGAARLHQSGAARQDDLDLRPDVGRAHLHQPDRRPERERSRRRGRALSEGRTLRADGGGSLDHQGAMDDAGAGQLSGQVSYARGRAYPATPAAAAVSKILSRRRLATGLGIVGPALRRASVLGAICRRRSHQTSPRSGRWRGRMAEKTTSASACGCK